MRLKLIKPVILVEDLDAEVLDDVLLPGDLALVGLDLVLEHRDGGLSLLRGPSLNTSFIVE